MKCSILNHEATGKQRWIMQLMSNMRTDLYGLNALRAL